MSLLREPMSKEPWATHPIPSVSPASSVFRVQRPIRAAVLLVGATLSGAVWSPATVVFVTTYRWLSADGDLRPGIDPDEPMSAVSSVHTAVEAASSAMLMTTFPHVCPDSR
jgi:hypothetical protein